ncbi:MAG: NAD(+) diphosphatase [Rectinemataceae bacterium]
METTEFFIFSGQDILLSDTPMEDGKDGVPARGPGLPAGSLDVSGAALRRDFEWEGRKCAAVGLDEKALPPAGFVRVPMRQALGMFDAAALKPAIKAAALVNWMAGALHCGACGSPLVDDDHESSGRRCTVCGRVHFPRISPAIIVLIKKGDSALLARNARFPGKRFGLVAGFVDPGESLEETVVREVREETGIEIADIRYRRSQPWPFPDSLMLAFTARWASGEARPDGKEIVELRWCRPDDLPSIPPPGSVARWLVDEFVRGAF